MGHLATAGWAEAVTEGRISRAVALGAHFRSYFFRPLPIAYVEFVEQAIDACSNGDVGALIVLPESLPIHPKDAFMEDGKLLIRAAALLDAIKTAIEPTATGPQA